MTSDQRAEFLSRVQGGQLAGMSHDRLRRAASAVLRSAGHRPGTLKLTEWLESARAQPAGSSLDVVPETPNPFGARDVHAAPEDSDLHRRIGLANPPQT